MPRLTLPQAAAELGQTPRWLTDWLRLHPADKAGEPYYTPAGRVKLFHPNDISRIELALREELKCRSASGRRVKEKRRTSKSEGPTSGSAWNALAELTGDQSLATECGRSSDASSSTGSTLPRKLSLIQGGLTS